MPDRSLDMTSFPVWLVCKAVWFEKRWRGALSPHTNFRDNPMGVPFNQLLFVQLIEPCDRQYHKWVLNDVACEYFMNLT